jgi:ketosteroid isomerase-like protein
MRDAALQRLIDYYQTLSPQSVKAIGSFYTEDAYFRDPFNEVRGSEKLQHIFEEMFVRLIDARFTINETIAEENGAILFWDFDFRMKSLKPQLPRRIHGLSHVRFAADGRVHYHRDYWDAAGELYEHFPVIGGVLRWLKRRAA